MALESKVVFGPLNKATTRLKDATVRTDVINSELRRRLYSSYQFDQALAAIIVTTELNDQVICETE